MGADSQRSGGRKVFGKVLVAIWIGLIVLGFIVQTTEGFGSLDGVIAWFVIGGLGFMVLLAFGAQRLIRWLIDDGGLGERERNEPST
jgi:hypothetical protein